MSMDAKKSIGLTALLMIFGVAAMFAGVKSLTVLVPAALLIWYEAGGPPGSGRN